MEVVKTTSDILCNSEVLQFLREEREKNLQKKSQFRKDNKGGQAATVVLETLTYLDKSSCANLNPNNTASFFDKLSKSGIELNSREKLQLLNHCPTVSIFINTLSCLPSICIPSCNLNYFTYLSLDTC